MEKYKIHLGEATGIALCKQEGIKLFFTDDLNARETAKIIGETLKISIITNKLLEDRDYGSFSGKPLEQFKKQGDAQANNSLGFNYSKWEGESGDDVRGRVIKFIEKIKIEYPQKNILIVTHADIIRMMYVLFLKLEYRKVFPIKNVSVHEFEI